VITAVAAAPKPSTTACVPAQDSGSAWPAMTQASATGSIPAPAAARMQRKGRSGGGGGDVGRHARSRRAAQPTD
jgi:hypothetical protein